MTGIAACCRLTLSTVLFLAVLASAGAVSAQTPKPEDMAEKQLLTCIEAAEARRLSGPDIHLACVGTLAYPCMKARDYGSYSATAGVCFAEERFVWEKILNRSFDALVARLSEIEGLRKSQGLEPLVPHLKLADELWKKSVAADCEFVKQQVIDGTARFDAPEYCKLALTARRTYFYRTNSP